MKIIYSVNNRIGSNNLLLRFLENLNGHEVKIAAYNNSSYSINTVDWLLNSIHRYNGLYIYQLHSTKYIAENIELILKDVAEFGPDLIISDSEHIFGYIANQFDIPLWYCSPLNLIEGVKWNKKIPYSYLFNQYMSHKLPKADKYLIYSPFCDILNPPPIKENYNWVRPYYNESKSVSIDENNRVEYLNKILRYIDLGDYCFTDGNTDNISNSIYNNKKSLVTP